MPLPFKSLDSASVTGAGVEKDLEGTFATHTMYPTLESGAGSHTVFLEGSHDGVNWRALGSSTSSSSVHSSDAVRYVRARLDISSGSRTASATIAST